jgi:hypothetical protein
MPVWAQIVLAALSGGALSKLIDYLRQNTASVWTEIGRLHEAIARQQIEIISLRSVNDAMDKELEALRVHAIGLQVEINDMCRKLNIEPKFSNPLIVPQRTEAKVKP